MTSAVPTSCVNAASRERRMLQGRTGEVKQTMASAVSTVGPSGHAGSVRPKRLPLLCLAAAATVPLGHLDLTLGVIVAVVVSLSSSRRSPAPWVRRIGLAAVLSAAATYFVAKLLLQVPVPVYDLTRFVSVAVVAWAVTNLAVDLAQAARYLAVFAIVNAGYTLIFRPGLTAGSTDDLWKYGLAFPFSIAVVYFSVRYGGRFLPPLALLSIGAYSLFANYRSMGLICVISLVVIGGKAMAGRGRRLRFLAFAVLGLVAASVLLPRALESGTFGQDVQAKTLQQSQEAGPIILGGRKEPPLSLAAISMRPLEGWGNAQQLSPSVNPSVFRRGVEVATNLGVKDPAEYTYYWAPSGNVSLHSILGVSWVEGGMLGAVFPLAVILLLIVAATRAHGRYAPLTIFVSVYSCWDILFSPWSIFRAETFAAVIVACAWSVAESRSSPRRLR